MDEQEEPEQNMQIMQRASRGPRRPPAKDVTVTADDPPSSGVTWAQATGRRWEPGKGKSKTDNRLGCKVCCGDGQDCTGAAER